VRAREVIIQTPGRIEVHEAEVSNPGPGKIRVRTSVCGISPGTELLAFRGKLPTRDDTDHSIDPHAGSATYPMRTGYCSVGVVDKTGPNVDPDWNGRRVFAFQPHGTHSIAETSDVISLSAELSDELATFIPNLETAIGLVMDGQPAIGERVVVLGQGIVGLLVTRLLSRYPLALLASADRVEERRERARSSGADLAIDPSDEEDRDRLFQLLMAEGEPSCADLIFELSGNPDALNDAISFAGFGARIVAGSWYGKKPAALDLGGRFHRNRISISSSQVSTINPAFSARWSKSRRMREVLRLLPGLALENLITHRFPIGQADQAFALLDQSPENALQVILTCSDDLDGST
jgi:2-desacetyl-2-hydroxyethyl bacteriochlorophyllide A dehydrogenase